MDLDTESYKRVVRVSDRDDLPSSSTSTGRNRMILVISSAPRLSRVGLGDIVGRAMSAKKTRSGNSLGSDPRKHAYLAYR